MTVESTVDVRAQRLRNFLAGSELSAERVAAQVDDVFGEPLLIVATGSIIAGYGNALSDLDIYAVVERPVASQVPLMSYEQGKRIDVVLFGADEVRQHDAAIGTGWPPRQTSAAEVTLQYRRLDALSRFALGARLSGDETWSTWHAGLTDRVTTEILSWHAAEAIRCATAARWLLSTKPQVAALRAADALLSALEVRVAGRGEIYLMAKWLGEKLRILGDDDGWRMFVRAMGAPYDPDQCARYVDEIVPLATELIRDSTPDALAGRFRWAEGVTHRSFGTQTLVSRWDLRTLQLDGDVPDLGGAGSPVALDQPLDGVLGRLFAANLLWFGIEASC